MSCEPCKQTFVAMAKLIRDLNRPDVPTDITISARRVAGMITVAGLHIVDREIEGGRDAGNR